MERIICAAIWYKNLPKQEYFGPVNIDKGIVVCGWRHGSIINQVLTLTKLRSVTYSEDATGESVQGFLTTRNRFVDRIEAHKIFRENGGVPEFNDELYSEDLY